MANIMLAEAKAYCDRCHQDEWLYLNDGEEYGLLCEACMNKTGAEALTPKSRKEGGER